MKQYNNETMEKGISLYLSLMIMTIFLAMSFGISIILLRQLEMVRGMGDSVIAFYAADTGIERALYGISYEGGGIGSSYSDSLDNKSSYEARVIAPNHDCDASNYCINSVGLFQGTKRAIEVKR